MATIVSASLNSTQLTNDDLEACIDVVESYWTQIQEYTSRPKLSNDDLETLFHYFEQLTEIVALDLANKQGRQKLLQCLEQKAIFNEYFAWVLKLQDANGRVKEHLLSSVYPLCQPIDLLSAVLPDCHLCQILVSAIDYVVLNSKQQQHRVSDGANSLLGHIVLAIAKAIAADQDLFLAVYSNRCALLPSYREYLEQSSRDIGQDRFPIVSAMLHVALIGGEAGDLSREAIVLLVDAVCQHGRSDIAIFLAENTDLCPVLATGLSGLFSTLPRTLAPDPNSVLFSSQSFESFFGKPEPVLFVECFRFVNRVVTLAHPAIRDRLVDFLYHGFLVPVLAPALNQPLGDELITTIVYFDYLCLQNLTDAQVAGAFIKFLLHASYDGLSVVDTLLKYLDLPSSSKSSSPGSNNKLAASTSCYWRLLFAALGIFNSFLSLRSACSEDIFYELIHKHLAGLTHLMRSQRLQLISATKSRLKSLCILCSLRSSSASNSQEYGCVLETKHSTNEVLPNAFYKRGADHYLSLVTMDGAPREQLPNDEKLQHVLSAAIVKSLEATAVGRQLLSEYTALLEEAPRRLFMVDKQTADWRRCGMTNNLTVGLCETHRQIVLDHDDDGSKTGHFFAADVWSDILQPNSADNEEEAFEAAKSTVAASTSPSSGFDDTLAEAERECDDLVDAISDEGDRNSIEDDLEKFDGIELNKLIPSTPSELPFAMSIASIGHQPRISTDSYASNSSSTTSSSLQSKISVGPFLTRIFELVDHFVDLPSPVIVALGTLISYLASIQHPLLAPLLLDPQLNVHPNIKSLPYVMSSVREKFLEKINSDGFSTTDVREILNLTCQDFSAGNFYFAEQMRHWSPSTSPLPTNENHFSSPLPSKVANKLLQDNEPPGSPRSFFSRLLLAPTRNSPRSAPNSASKLLPGHKGSGVSTPVKRPTLADNSFSASPVGQSLSASSSAELEMIARGAIPTKGGSSDERLAILSRSLILFDVTLLELAAISSSASRRYI